MVTGTPLRHHSGPRQSAAKEPVFVNVPRCTRVALLTAVSVLVGSCAHPCDILEARVCETQVDEARCELLQDPQRRELLTRATCEGILDAMDGRR